MRRLAVMAVVASLAFPSVSSASIPRRELLIERPRAAPTPPNTIASKKTETGTYSLTPDSISFTPSFHFDSFNDPFRTISVRLEAWEVAFEDNLARCGSFFDYKDKTGKEKTAIFVVFSDGTLKVYLPGGSNAVTMTHENNVGTTSECSVAVTRKDSITFFGVMASSGSHVYRVADGDFE